VRFAVAVAVTVAVAVATHLQGGGLNVGLGNISLLLHFLRFLV
jgi:hypothetical protein